MAIRNDLISSSFFEETPHGRKYKYLHIEQVLLSFHYMPVRFIATMMVPRYLASAFLFFQFFLPVPGSQGPSA